MVKPNPLTQTLLGRRWPQGLRPAEAACSYKFCVFFSCAITTLWFQLCFPVLNYRLNRKTENRNSQLVKPELTQYVWRNNVFEKEWSYVFCHVTPILRPLEFVVARQGERQQHKSHGLVWQDEESQQELKVNTLEVRCIKAARAGLFLILSLCSFCFCCLLDWRHPRRQLTLHV